MTDAQTFSAFAGDRLVAAGPLRTLLPAAKAWADRRGNGPLAFFDDETGREAHFDLGGTLAQVLARVLPSEEAPRPGRPRLGVVGREVSLLPRHWEWLEEHPNGISAALRRLVDEARKREPGRQRARALRAAASRFLTTTAGDREGFEEACRALFAGEQRGFERIVARWPEEIRRRAVRWSREAARLDAADAAASGEAP